MTDEAAASGTGTISGISPPRGSPTPAAPSAWSRSTGLSRSSAIPKGCVPPPRRARALGFEGKMAIHPSQIETIHEVLTPTSAQIAWANEVIEAMAAAEREGRGAVKDKNGDMIDLVHIKLANKLLERAARHRGKTMSALRGNPRPRSRHVYRRAALRHHPRRVRRRGHQGRAAEHRRFAAPARHRHRVRRYAGVALRSPQQEMRDARSCAASAAASCCGSLPPKCDIDRREFPPRYAGEMGPRL